MIHNKSEIRDNFIKSLDDSQCGIGKSEIRDNFIKSLDDSQCGMGKIPRGKT